MNACALNKDELVELTNLFSSMIDGKLSDDLSEVVNSGTLQKVKELVDQTIVKFSKSRTGKLWIQQYMHMVALMRQFIKSERTGNWELHLKSLTEMVPYYAAAGHNNYLKSTYLYLQNMFELKNSHPHIDKLFQSGFHVIRRSDRYWAGLSADLVIEQEFMRNMKASGSVLNCIALSIFYPYLPFNSQVDSPDGLV